MAAGGWDADRADGALFNVAGCMGTATVRRFRGCGKPGASVTRCTAGRCCRRRCRTSAEAYGLHPALLDAALHVLGLADAGVARVSDGSLLLPFEWSEVSLLATGARELRVRASVERGGEGEAWRELQLADGSGRAVARVGGLRLREASEAQIREAARSEVQHLYRLDWRPVALSAAGPEALPPLIVGGDGQLANRLGLDWVESVAALVARLDEGGRVPARVVFDHLAEPARVTGRFWPPRTLAPNVR